MSTPLVRLASLDLLRGFVAVGRRMSITLAADDLCLTQSAVSRQVSALEEALGVKLLVRGHRSIAFTPEGERLFRSADSAVQQLQDAIGAIRVAAERRPVTITASIGVTGLWLLPRLARFQLQYPDIDVRVAGNETFIAKVPAGDPATRATRGTPLTVSWPAGAWETMVRVFPLMVISWTFGGMAPTFLATWGLRVSVEPFSS